MPRPLQAHIHLAALTHNLQVVRQLAPHSKIMAVVKANGYGHGLLRVAQALAGVDGFGVLAVEEALALREAGFRQPILLLEGFFSPDELPVIAEQSLSVVIHSSWQINQLEIAGLPLKLSVFIKINTGMNRLGFKPEEFGAALERLKRLPMVGQITLMTHFSSADEPVGVADPLSTFKAAIDGLQYPTSLANSAAILRFPEAHADWVRPGIMLYGASPFADTSAQKLGLKPVMTLASEIIAVQHLQPGETLGYGGTFVADKPMRVGVVACGYADGYPRHAPTGTPILVAEQHTRTLGRVSMDMLFADLTDIPAAGVGSPVVLWGEGLPVEEVARAAGTISYELLCARAERVPVVVT